MARILACCALLVSGSARLAAHPANVSSAQAVVHDDGTFTVRFTFDVLAFALNDTPERVPDTAMLALLDGPRAELERRLAAARPRFARHARVLADDEPVATTLSEFPTADDVLRQLPANTFMRLPVLRSCEMGGRLPPGTRGVTIQIPEVLGPVVLSVETPGGDVATAAVSESEPSMRVPVRLGRAGVEPAPAKASRLGGWPAAIGSMISLGFRHILPRGIDHVLFVLGLFLLGGRVSALLWQVTAFTLAHTLTLGLALYGLVRVPSGIVEPLIALSIVFVAVDNFRGTDLRWWRLAVVFGFGLVHGLGFADALLSLGLPRERYLGALLSFNVGVELGQLAVIAAAFLAVGWFRSHQRYRRFIALPASGVIALVAMAWTAQRLAG